MQWTLHQWTAGIGAAHIVLGVIACATPAAARRGLAGFPRNALAGRVLSAAAFFWCARLVRAASLGSFDFVKPWLYVAAVAAWLAAMAFMDELLGPRALGGLLLLAAAPLLEAARLHPAAAGRVLSVLGYVWVAAGMTWVAAPWRLRNLAAAVTRTPGRLRAAGAASAAVGAALLTLAFTVLA